MIFFRGLVLFLLFSSFQFLYAQSSVGLRNPHACGLYLSSLVEDSEGVFKAPLDAEAIENYLRSEQAKADLKPVLVFKDKRTWNRIHDADHLAEALKSGNALPIVNKKTVNLVGVELTGRERRRLARLVRALVHEQLADLEVRVRILGRPEQPGLYAETESGWVRVADAKMRDYSNPKSPTIEKYFQNLDPSEASRAYRLKGLSFRERFPILGQVIDAANPFSRRRPQNTIQETRELVREANSAADLELGWEKPATYAFHRFVYFFPLAQDYQKYTREEISAGAGKLLINTPVSILSLAITNPTAVVIPVSLVNFTQSSVTAAYSVVISNWFSRSARDAHFERLGKNVFLSSLFTIPLYWSGRGSLEALSAISTAAGWAKFVAKKWSAVAFNVWWRFFFSNGTYKWEQIAKERVDELDRNDFPSDAAFAQEKKAQRDAARATRSRIESVASTIGTVGYLLASVMPTNFVPESLGIENFQYGWGHLIMTGLGGVGAIIYFKPDVLDQVRAPERLEALHEGVAGAASWVRASKPVNALEKSLRSYYERRAEVEAQEGRNFRGERDLREFFELDDQLHAMVDENPDLIDLIHDNQDVNRLLRRHPEYREMIPE